MMWRLLTLSNNQKVDLFIPIMEGIHLKPELQFENEKVELGLSECSPPQLFSTTLGVKDREF